jgi:hypothetical protein
MPELSHATRTKERMLLVRLRSTARTYGQKVGLFAVFLLAAWFAFSWFQTINRVVRDYSPIPIFDYWRTAAFLHFYQALDLRVLWLQHNDHRIIFPEIVFATDLLLLHGREILPISLSFLSYFGNWAVLAWAFWSVDSIAKELRMAALLLAGIVMGWQGSAIIFISPFLFQWTLTQLGALLSLAFLVRLKETGRASHLTLMILSAIVATYSSSNGLVLWPVLIVWSLLLSIPQRQMWILTGAGALSIGIYFIGYKFASTLSIKTLLLHPIYLIEFLGSYLSMPFGAIKSPALAMRAGVAMLGIVVLLAVLAFRTGRLRSRAGVMLFGSYLFLILTALLTAAGRMDLADSGFFTAKVPRYLSGPLFGWGIFVLLALWFASEWKKPVGCSLVCAFALFFLVAFPKLRWWLQVQESDFPRAQLAALAMEQGIYDPTIMLGVFPDPVSAELWSKGLRDNHLSVFYKTHAKWLGRPAEQFARKVNAVLPGAVTYTLPVRDGVEVAGWFDTFDTNFRHAQWILFTNEAGQIVGFGRKLPAGFPNSIDSPDTPPSLGWAGFINLKYPLKTFHAFVIDKRGLIPLKSSITIPDEQIADWRQVGVPIAGIQWQMDPGWTRDGIPPDWPFGHPPAGPVYGSWSSKDAKTGQLLSSAIARPDDGCMILPILQGPGGAGLSASIVDAANNHAIAHAWFNNGANAWRFWRMQIPAGVKQVRIDAEDRGKDWGEWLAVGNPANCK